MKRSCMTPAAGSLAICALLWLFTTPGYGADAGAGAVLELDDAVALALEHNPARAARRAQANALASVPSQAGALPDPWLTAEPGRAAMNQVKLGVTQALPYPGKRGLARDAAQYEADAAALDVQETALALTLDVTRAWYRVFYLDRALEIHHRSLDVVRQFIGVAEARYRVGQGLQQDVLLAQLELSKLLDGEIGLVGERRGAVAALNALLYRPPATPVTLPAQVDEGLAPVAAEEALVERALMARPKRAMQQRQVDAATAQVALARKDYRPDFMLGANYEWREDDTDMRSVMLAMSLPLRAGSRQDRALDQRNAELLARRYELQDMEATLAADVVSARADYERAREQARLLKEGVLPQAAQTVASMLAGYQVGKVDFLNLAQARITLHEYETRYWQVLSDARTALARLVATIGEEHVYE